MISSGSTVSMPPPMVFRIQLTQSIAYAERSRHRLDVCRPRGVAAAPVIIFFYGGASQSGYKELYRHVPKALARRGSVAVVPDYRIYPGVCYPAYLDDGALGARWGKDNIARRGGDLEVVDPEFLDDGALVVRWVKDNIARFGGDPNKLFLKGHSACAHIAAMLSIDARWLGKVGLDPGRDITGLIGIAGPYDLMPLRDETLKV